MHKAVPSETQDVVKKPFPCVHSGFSIVAAVSTIAVALESCLGERHLTEAASLGLPAAARHPPALSRIRHAPTDVSTQQPCSAFTVTDHATGR
eukprot:2908916-Pleurochrysis_carterae.AAC.1